jgi:hypothetical protein
METREATPIGSGIGLEQATDARGWPAVAMEIGGEKYLLDRFAVEFLADGLGKMHAQIRIQLESSCPQT